LEGAEAMVVHPEDPESLVLTLRNGSIYSITLEPFTARVLVDVGGCPLGLDFGPDGTLYVAEPMKGIRVYSSCLCEC
jgi:hypothetical protein